MELDLIKDLDKRIEYFPSSSSFKARNLSSQASQRVQIFQGVIPLNRGYFPVVN